MISKDTEPRDAVFAEERHRACLFSKRSESILYRISPIGEVSSFLYRPTYVFSAAYDWSRDCLVMVSIRFQERVDAEDQESGERRSGLYSERSNGRRKCSRDANTIWIRAEGSPNRLGLKRPNPRGSRRCQVPGELRDGQHQAQELPGIHSRVDHERTSRFWRFIGASPIAIAPMDHIGRHYREIGIECRVGPGSEPRQ
jgi:hypothetical protein